jgi:hypothetical protein
MMFRVQVGDRRNRHVIVSKVRALLRRGPAGVLRLLKNAARLLAGQWEQPADSAWWERAMRRAGFGEIKIQLLEHEGGLITARRSLRSRRQRRRLRAPRSAARMGTP